MSDKNIGLIKKYEVVKISSPFKKIDAIVLEFDDVISRKAIRRYASLVHAHGYETLCIDLKNKCDLIDGVRGEISLTVDEMDFYQKEITKLKKALEVAKEKFMFIDASYGNDRLIQQYSQEAQKQIKEIMEKK